jgi:hypothetical protein
LEVQFLVKGRGLHVLKLHQGLGPKLLDAMLREFLGHFELYLHIPQQQKKILGYVVKMVTVG